MKKVFATLFVAFGIQTNAGAALLVEPFVGYQLMVMDLKTGSSVGAVPFKLDATGLAYGLRLGYSGPLYFTALDVGLAGLNMKVKEGPPVFPEGATLHSSMGATIGLNLPIVRPYLGYNFDVQSRGSDSGFVGTGYKAGVGFAFIPKARVNFEYLTSTFTKYNAASEVTLPNAGSYESASLAGFMVSLSAPYTF